MLDFPLKFEDPDSACFWIKGAALLLLNIAGAHDLLSSEDVATQHPPQASSQLVALFLSSLTAQRNHVLGILGGLSEEALLRPVLPSGWSCLGLVQHLALDVERFWFRAVITGERTALDKLAGVGGNWQLASDVRVEDIFDL